MVGSYPSNILIETTTLCNLNCEYCALKETNRVGTTMSYDKFKSLSPYFINFNSVLLSGLAEPLMNPDIVKYIQCIKNINNTCAVRIISNAMLLNDSLIEELILSGLDSFGFSLDGIDSSVNDTIRKGSNSIKILKNIARFSEKKEQLKKDKPVLTSAMVLQKNNYKCLPEMIRTLADIGVSILAVNGLEPYYENLKDSIIWGNGYIPDDLPDIIHETIEVAKTNQVVLRLNDFFPQKKFCSSINMPIVLPNGDVMACSVLAYKRTSFYEINDENDILRCKSETEPIVFGNIFQDSIETIWNSHEYSVFRQQVEDNEFPDTCQYCLMKHGVICATHSTPPSDVLRDLQINRI